MGSLEKLGKLVQIGDRLRSRGKRAWFAMWNAADEPQADLRRRFIIEPRVTDIERSFRCETMLIKKFAENRRLSWWGPPHRNEIVCHPAAFGDTSHFVLRGTRYDEHRRLPDMSIQESLGTRNPIAFDYRVNDHGRIPLGQNAQFFFAEVDPQEQKMGFADLFDPRYALATTGVFHDLAKNFRPVFRIE